MAIIKTLALPMLIVVPWALVSLDTGWKNFFEEKIITQPVLVFLLLFPGMCLFAARLTKGIFGQKYS